MACQAGREGEDHCDILRRRICRHVLDRWMYFNSLLTIVVDETYQGKFDASYKGGSMVAQLDPMVFISAVASVTTSVSFAITRSLSYIPVSSPLQSTHPSQK
jgi:hypothetical protein